MITESTTRRSKEPWDRRPGESEVAYHAFECYLEMPSGERTLEGAYRLHTGNPSAGPSDSCKGWARKYDWRERASAYDDHIRRLRREAHERGMVEEAEKQGQEMERLRSDMLELARRNHEKALAILAQPLDIANYTMGHAVQMTKQVVEIYKLMRDEARGAPPAEDDWGEVSDEYLEGFVNKMAQEVDRSTERSESDSPYEEGSEENNLG